MDLQLANFIFIKIEFQRMKVMQLVLSTYSINGKRKVRVLPAAAGQI